MASKRDPTLDALNRLIVARKGKDKGRSGVSGFLRSMAEKFKDDPTARSKKKDPKEDEPWKSKITKNIKEGLAVGGEIREWKKELIDQTIGAPIRPWAPPIRAPKLEGRSLLFNPRDAANPTRLGDIAMARMNLQYLRRRK